MSYDIRLVINTGGPRPAAVTECKNPTYNLFEMFKLALGRPICELDGMVAGDAILILKNATNHMKKSPARFKKLNPKNGWGDYEGALKSLCWLLEMCQEHPLATVEI